MVVQFVEGLPLANVEEHIVERRRGRGIQKTIYTYRKYRNDVVNVIECCETGTSVASIKSEFVEKVRKSLFRKHPEYKDWFKQAAYINSLDNLIVRRIERHYGSSTNNPTNLVKDWVKGIMDNITTVSDAVELVVKAIEDIKEEEHNHEIDRIVWKLQALPAEDLEKVLARLGHN